MTTLDPTIAKTLTDAELELEMETLMANRPEYRVAVPGTEDAIENMKARALTSTAAELTIYNRETGEPSQVIFDALKARMKQTFPLDHTNPAFAGKRVYSLRKEEVPDVIRGDLSCPLNYASPAPEALALGFGRGARSCKKPAYFLTEYDVELHVEKNHKRYFELREQQKEQEEKDIDRDLQRQTLAAMQAMARGSQPQPRIVSKPIVAPDVADALEYDANGVTNTLTCECGWTTVKGKASLGFHKRLHCSLREGA